MSKKTYIAAVVVTCYVDGERKDIPPGEPIPELSEHDVGQLLAMKAIKEPAAEEAEAKAAAKAQRAAGKDFADAKAKVQAADASITPPPASTAQS